MGDPSVQIQGFTVTISGTVTADMTVHIVILEANIDETETFQVGGPVSRSFTLPNAGTYDLTIDWGGPVSFATVVTVPGGLALS